jgi:hypothetical protein
MSFFIFYSDSEQYFPGPSRDPLTKTLNSPSIQVGFLSNRITASLQTPELSVPLRLHSLTANMASRIITVNLNTNESTVSIP